jgi:hypothetical protein
MQQSMCRILLLLLLLLLLLPNSLLIRLGFNLVVATVDLQNSVAAASSLGLFSFGSCCNPSVEGSCNNNF